MPALTYSAGAYWDAFTTLTSFTGALPNLRWGQWMFYGSKLTSWDVGLPSLLYGSWMFRGADFTEWHTDLPSLVGRVPGGDNVSDFMPGTLVSFEGDLSLLQGGWRMFAMNSKLTSFSSALPSLTDGDVMFHNCKLDLPSVQTIARTIKDNSSMATPPILTLGMAKALQGQVEGELNLIRAKGWALTAQYN